MHAKFLTIIMGLYLFILTHVMAGGSIEDGLDQFLMRCKADRLNHFVLVLHPQKTVGVIIASSAYLHPASVSYKYSQKLGLYAIAMPSSCYSLLFIGKRTNDLYYTKHIPTGNLDSIMYTPSNQKILGRYLGRMFPILDGSTYKDIFFQKGLCKAISPQYGAFESWGFGYWRLFRK